MTMKRLILVWVMILCLVPLGAWAEETQEMLFAESAEALFPGWKATSVGIGEWEEDECEIYMIRVSDQMLWGRSITASTDDLSGDQWEIWDNAPIPLTAAGAEVAITALSNADLERNDYISYYTINSLIEENNLLPECAAFLLRDGEKLVRMHAYDSAIIAVAEDAAGKQYLRVSSWDGTAYGAVLTSMPFDSIGYNSEHSYGDYMEVFCASGECALEYRNGVWQMSWFTPKGAENGSAYWIQDECLLDMAVLEIVPYQNNDAWHYGSFTIDLTLQGIDFDAIPTMEEAIPLLDASAWACVKMEGAALYDAPEGTVLASCFCRVPGRIMRQEGKWTQLRIGSDELGLDGWFQTEDLAFGAETEEVICSFPSYEFWEQPDETAFERMIEDTLNTSFYTCDAWLIAKKTDGDWLMLISQQLVCTPPNDQIGDTWPTEHAWDESTFHEWDDE